MRSVLLSTLVALAGLRAPAYADAGAAVVAEDGDVPALDEAAFVAALERAPRIARLDAEVALARAETIAAGVRPNPALALDREEVFPDGGVATTYARVTIPLDVAGRRSRRVAAASARARAVSAEVERARLVALIDGLGDFYRAAHARHALELLRADRDVLVRAVAIVERRRGAGVASGYDLQRLELELAAYDDLLASAALDLDAARERLGAVIGTGAIDAAHDLALPAASPAPEAPPTDRADQRAARARRDAADRTGALAARGWIPDVGVSLGAMAADVDDARAYGYTVGLTLSVPLFDRGQGDRATARAARAAAEAELRVLDAAVAAEVRIARAQLDRRVAQARRFADAQLPRLDALIRAAETGYREGETSIVELLDAYRTARTVRARDLELRRDARLAELALALAIGHRP